MQNKEALITADRPRVHAAMTVQPSTRSRSSVPGQAEEDFDVR